VMDERGQLVGSTARATLPGLFGISMRDHYTLPSRFSQRSPTAGFLIALAREYGITHIVLGHPGRRKLLRRFNEADKVWDCI